MSHRIRWQCHGCRRWSTALLADTDGNAILLCVCGAITAIDVQEAATSPEPEPCLALQQAEEIARREFDQPWQPWKHGLR